MNHNWSATKQRLHPQSVAEISRHSVLSGDRIWQCGTSVSVSRHFLLQAPQCPCSMRKQFSRDHCCRGRSKPGCRIVGSHTRWELTTWADFQLCLHRLLMSTDYSDWLVQVTELVDNTTQYNTILTVFWVLMIVWFNILFVFHSNYVTMALLFARYNDLLVENH